LIAALRFFDGEPLSERERALALAALERLEGKAKPAQG
jgi:hypothetical protein